MERKDCPFASSKAALLLNGKMIYYTADLHFHYKPILETRNDLASIFEMDEMLIRNWNETVKEDDTVYVVGDVGYNDNRVPGDALERLRGHKHLIRGNHDVGFDDGERLYDYFETVTDFNEIEDGSHHIILCHYPIVHNKKSYMIHGHLHQVNGIYYDILKKLPQVLNAGVDINGYRPVTLPELIENNNLYFERTPEDFTPAMKRRTLSGEGLLPAKPNFKPIPERR